ncbi:FkbM family methyltransferase [Sediminicoccus rosea]|jgi:FkbM family methyltransferase|uniref:FkbM family methyltransferase n=1 Tax=Sediminicoccus rosea TaxID=1225128 RepID=A0ABZ0PM36_9PROT|nr:FkbM family methyltransferase [Sediminicoccus rosea]WPB86286.1 FkbM family methyltransferase [Sediminicoccus rosea]
MSRSLARFLSGLVRNATRPMRPRRAEATRALVSEMLVQRLTVPTEAGPLLVECPSARALHDPQGFGQDEPETVAWIMGLPAGCVLWDIGANIGLYSLFAARRGLRVLAFEPSASSFAAMTRNIEINGFDDRISAYCLAFAEQTALVTLNMANTAAGHSMHSIEAREGGFRQAVPGFSVDEFMARFAPPPPDAIKLDVDGIEPAILRGAMVTLRRHVCEVLVEIDGANAAAGGNGIPELLAEAGFTEAPMDGAARNRRFVKT